MSREAARVRQRAQQHYVNGLLGEGATSVLGCPAAVLLAEGTAPHDVATRPSPLAKLVECADAAPAQPATIQPPSAGVPCAQ